MKMHYLIICLLTIFQLNADEWIHVHGLAQEKPFADSTIHTFTPLSLLEGCNEHFDIIIVREIYNESDAETVYELFKAHFAHFLYSVPTATTPGTLILTKYPIGLTKSVLHKDPIPYISSTFSPTLKRYSSAKREGIILCGVLENDDYDPPVRDLSSYRERSSHEEVTASIGGRHRDDGSWIAEGQVGWRRHFNNGSSFELSGIGTYDQDKNGSRSIGGEIRGTWCPPDRDK